MQDHPLTAERDAGVALPSWSVFRLLLIFAASTIGWTVIFILGAIIALTLRVA